MLPPALSIYIIHVATVTSIIKKHMPPPALSHIHESPPAQIYLSHNIIYEAICTAIPAQASLVVLSFSTLNGPSGQAGKEDYN